MAFPPLPSKPTLSHPALVISAWIVLFLLGQCLTLEHRLAYQIPTMAFGARSSVFFFLLDCIVVIAIARKWPLARDAATVIGGSAWVLCAAGWRYALFMVALSALIHYGLRRIHAHLAMLLTAILLIAGFYYWVPARPFSGTGFFVDVSNYVTRLSMVLSSTRLIMYAFEAGAVPKKARSFLSVLAYSPLGIFLWPTDPPLTSYLMYTTKTPQPILDQRGAHMLYRSGCKYVLMVCLIRLMNAALSGIDFSAAPAWVFALALIIGPAVFYLRLSLVADFTYGLSSLAGYHTIDAFDTPFLAENPIHFWQKWNIPVMSFLRRAFIFPIARQRRSFIWVIIAGMIGTILWHWLFSMLLLGPNLSLLGANADLRHQSIHFTATGIILALGLPFYKPEGHRRLPARLLGIIATQVVMALLFFGMLVEVCPKVTNIPRPAFDLVQFLENWIMQMTP